MSQLPKRKAFNFRPTQAEVEGSPSTVELIMANTFIDKTAIVYDLLVKEDLFVEDLEDFKSRTLLLVYCRRFGKSTFLRFLRTVFNPQPRLNGYDSGAIRDRIATYSKGRELLQFGCHPVFYMDMTKAETIPALKEAILQALMCAGLNQEMLNTIAAKPESLPPSTLLTLGVGALNTKFMEDTGQSFNNRAD